MPRTILDIHVLQTVPPSNLNRDDTGTPKTAVYGGVRRARVSSQAWKHATRKAFNELLDPSELGVRTKKVVAALATRIVASNPELGPADPAKLSSTTCPAIELATLAMEQALSKTLEAPGRKTKDEEAGNIAPESSYLLFLSRQQLDALADLVLANSSGGDPAVLGSLLRSKDKEVKKRAAAFKAEVQQALNSKHSVDIALFGRMVADAAKLNVDASTQVAHAIGVHRSEIESDYYTAVDDYNKDDETGAGMIGSIDFNTATLYRYAAVDVDDLHRNLVAGLHDEEPSTPTKKAVDTFLQAFITSLPSGKVNSFGHNTLPSAVIVTLRTRRPISFVDAFEEPVRKDGENGGFLTESCERLARHVPELERAFGLPAERTWVMRVGEATRPLAQLGTEMSLPHLIDDVVDTVGRRLESGT